MVATESIAGDAAGVARAAELVRAGRVVAVPTETVYGLAADATNAAAIGRIYQAKERPLDNPLIVHVGRRFGGVDALVAAGFVDEARLGREQRAAADRLFEAFWPGPLSVILPRGAGLAAEVSAGTDTVGLRMPANPVFLDLLDEVGVPLAAPSANRANRISPTSAGDVLAELGGRIPLVLDGGATRVGVESTVVRVTDRGGVVLLRPGGVPRNAIERIVGAPIEEPPRQAGRRHSPGRRAVHYAPDKPVLLCRRQDDPSSLVRSASVARLGVLCFASGEAAVPPDAWRAALEGVEVALEALADSGDGRRAAAGLFAALRALDAGDCDAILVELPDESAGLWPAIADRLVRAGARGQSR